MATNMNVHRKSNLGEYGSNIPMEYYNMGINNNASMNFQNLPSTQNMIAGATMGSQTVVPFPQTNFDHGMNNYPGQSRQFQENIEGIPTMKYPQMTSTTPAGVFEPNTGDPYQLAMVRKFRPPSMFGINKNMDPSTFVQQQRNIANSSAPWLTDHVNQNNRMHSLQKPGIVSRHDPNYSQTIPPDQNFPSPGSAGSPRNSFPMSAAYMANEMFVHGREQPFPGRNVTSGNFNAPEFYQQDALRVANYHQAQVSRAPSNYLTNNQRNSSSPFGHSVIQKAPDSVYHQQFSAGPKTNGPSAMMSNMVDERQVTFPSANYPGGPQPPQMSGKPGYQPSHSMRGTLSPNVTIGMPKKPAFRQQEEAVTSPGNNQNAAAVAAAAAVLAAVNTANPDSHNVSSRPPSVPAVPSRPASLHSKDPRSPSTSIISDHKSESGGSGINDIRATPSPVMSLTRNTPQHPNEHSTQLNLPMDFETGRVPSPSVHQLSSSDVEAMIQPVSNLPLMSENMLRESSRRKKRRVERKHGPSANMISSTLPLPFSPSMNTDFDLDMISATLNDSSLGKLYKISDDPSRKDFLDKLVWMMEQDDKSLNQLPNFNGSVLDLFKLYMIVSRRGGMQEVSRKNVWIDVAYELTKSSTNLTNEHLQTLKAHYIHYLLPYEDKFGRVRSDPVANNSHLPSAITTLPSNSEPRNIDLSTMTYKNLFQSNSKVLPYNQTATPIMQQQTFPNATPSSQGYPTTPPIQHPSYRNSPGYTQSSAGYTGYPQGTPRIPGYPSGHSAYSNHQYSNVQGPASQMSAYHNGMVPPSRYPNFPRNVVPPDAMLGQFNRAAAINKQLQQDTQSQAMFANYQQQGQQHPPEFLYQQQQSTSMSSLQMDKRNSMHGTMGSPRSRVQASWGPRYPESAAASAGTSTPFYNSHSPVLKQARPPPPYPHTKQERPSPTSQSAATNLQLQAMKTGASSGLAKKEDELFPSGCVEATQMIVKKKRRLTARDIGPVEAWRIMMSLKSGLLTETAWALDTLTVLLSDDTTASFFKLSHLPGFLDTVVEHFRRNLINVFGILREDEISVGLPEGSIYDESNESLDELLDDMRFDSRARESFSSLIVTGCLPDLEDHGFTGGYKDWITGGGDTTVHIHTHFETNPSFYEREDVEGHVGCGECDCEHLEADETSESEDIGCCGCHELVDEDGDASGHCGMDADSCLSIEIEKDTKCNSLPTHDEVNDIEKTKSPVASAVDLKQESSENSQLHNKCQDEHSTPSVDDYKCASNSVVENGERQTDSEEKQEDSTTEEVEKKHEDPSSLLIKRLKTELDLDIETISQDSAESTTLSSVKTDDETRTIDDVKTSVPSNNEYELKQEFPLSSLTLSQDSAIKTCNCVSNIVRNLSFVPGNDVEMARNPSLLLILAKLLLLYHNRRSKSQPHSSDGEYIDTECWWQDCLDTLRENTLVTVANISGYLDFSHITAQVSRLLLDGLLHWLVSNSAVADEPLRSTSVSVILTPKQLVLETLAKMSVLSGNVDFLFNSSDKVRLAKAYEYLVKLFSDKTNEVTREFSLVLLSSFTHTNEESFSMSSERNLFTVLVGYLEDSRDRVESMAVRGLHAGMFRDNDLRVSMGMLRRAASLLSCIAKRTPSRHLIPFQERILDLSMSRSLDAEIQLHLSDVLFQISR